MKPTMTGTDMALAAMRDAAIKLRSLGCSRYAQDLEQAAEALGPVPKDRGDSRRNLVQAYLADQSQAAFERLLWRLLREAGPVPVSDDAGHTIMAALDALCIGIVGSDSHEATLAALPGETAAEFAGKRLLTFDQIQDLRCLLARGH